MGTRYVNYSCLDERGVAIFTNRNHYCFQELFSDSIPALTKTIVVYVNLDCVPFSKLAIKRFILIMNKAGFPCRRSYVMGQLLLECPLDGYKKKVHVLSTLTLFRMLFEPGISETLEILFWILDKAKAGKIKPDYVRAIADAHCKIGYEHLKFYVNSGHAVTFPSNGAVPSSEELFKRFSQSWAGLNAIGNPGINAAWRK